MILTWKVRGIILKPPQILIFIQQGKINELHDLSEKNKIRTTKWFSKKVLLYDIFSSENENHNFFDSEPQKISQFWDYTNFCDNVN